MPLSAVGSVLVIGVKTVKRYLKLRFLLSYRALSHRLSVYWKYKYISRAACRDKITFRYIIRKRPMWLRIRFLEHRSDATRRIAASQRNFSSKFPFDALFTSFTRLSSQIPTISIFFMRVSAPEVLDDASSVLSYRDLLLKCFVEPAGG